jgi:type I restriction enzyme R subunit
VLLPPKLRLKNCARIIKRESAHTEFKSSVRWDHQKQQKNKEIEQTIIRAVAAFLNTDGGDLFIGVDDAGAIIGLIEDYLPPARCM